MRGFRERTSVETALALLEARTSALDAETVPVGEAGGRVAAADIVAAVSVPHFARAAMDGYAVVAESTLRATASAPIELAVVGEARPGRPHGAAIRCGEALRIATGAPMPEGADAVIVA